MAHSMPNSLAFRFKGSFFSLSQHLSEMGNSLYLLYFLKLRLMYSRELFLVFSVTVCWYVRIALEIRLEYMGYP